MVLESKWTYAWDSNQAVKDRIEVNGDISATIHAFSQNPLDQDPMK